MQIFISRDVNLNVIGWCYHACLCMLEVSDIL